MSEPMTPERLQEIKRTWSVSSAGETPTINALLLEVARLKALVARLANDAGNPHTSFVNPCAIRDCPWVAADQIAKEVADAN